MPALAYQGLPGFRQKPQTTGFAKMAGTAWPGAAGPGARQTALSMRRPWQPPPGWQPPPPPPKDWQRQFIPDPNNPTQFLEGPQRPPFQGWGTVNGVPWNPMGGPVPQPGPYGTPRVPGGVPLGPNDRPLTTTPYAPYGTPRVPGGGGQTPHLPSGPYGPLGGPTPAPMRPAGPGEPRNQGGYTSDDYLQQPGETQEEFMVRMRPTLVDGPPIPYQPKPGGGQAPQPGPYGPLGGPYGPLGGSQPPYAPDRWPRPPGGAPAPSPQPPAPSPSPIYSPIQPQEMYSNRTTQAAINQALAGAHQTAYGLPTAKMAGFSTSSPGLLGRSTMDAAQAIAGGAQQAEGFGLADRLANAQQLLSGQVARGGDVLGQLGNLASVGEASNRYGSDMARLLVEAVQGRMGGLGNLLGGNLQDRAWWENYGIQQQQAKMNQLQSLMSAIGWQ